MFLEKTKLDTVEVLILKAYFDSYIGHGKFISVDNVLREYNEKKEEMKNSETSAEYILQKQWKLVASGKRKIIRT